MGSKDELAPYYNTVAEVCSGVALLRRCQGSALYGLELGLGLELELGLGLGLGLEVAQGRGQWDRKG